LREFTIVARIRVCTEHCCMPQRYKQQVRFQIWPGVLSRSFAGRGLWGYLSACSGYSNIPSCLVAAYLKQRS